jgi:uncharacterized membrane protein
MARLRNPTLLVWLLILAYVLFFSAYSLQRHASLHSFAADLSYIDQPMWNTLHGHFLERTLDDRQVSRVAEHLEPIIVPVAFVFYLWDDVRAILVVQTVVLALGALPVYWIARAQISNIKYQISNVKSPNSKLQSLISNLQLPTSNLPRPAAAGQPVLASGPGGGQSQILPLAFVFAYLMFPALQAANVADFHADPFVVAPLLFAFWYATQRRYGAMWVWAALAMLVKENLPTLTFMLGGYLFLSPVAARSADSGARFSASPLRRFLTPDSRRHGLALMAVSLAWFCVATFVIVAPLARQVYGSEGPIYLVERYAGSGGLAGLLALLGEPDRLGYLAGLLASVGWLALLAPEYLLLGLPVLAANMLSNFPGQYSGEQHYSAPLAAVFIIAAIYGARRLIGLASRRFPATPLRRSGAPALVVWLLAWSLGYHYLRGWTPLARDFEWPQVTAHTQLLDRFASQIPPDAPLSTTPPLHPHFAHREKIYVFPTIADAEFVLLDVSGVTDAHPNDVRGTFDRLIKSGEFGIVDAADGYVLLGKGAGGQTLPDGFYDFARARQAQPRYPLAVEFDGRLRCLGYDVVDDPRWRLTHLRLYWQALAPLSADLRVWPFVFSPDGLLVEDTSQRPMVAPLWYPPSQWKPGEIVVTETVPWNLGSRFNVGLAVVRSAGGGADAAAAFADPARRLPVSSSGSGVDLFHGQTWAQVGAFARVGRYLAPATEGLSLSPLDATFAEGIRLDKYQISNIKSQISNSESPTSNLQLPISNLKSQISVVLQWRATAPVARDYTVFVHVVAPDGSLVAQADARPGWVAPWPSNRWLPGQPVLDGHRISLLAGLPSGRYQVRVGLYYWETMERVPLRDGSDEVLLGDVQIGP